MDKDRDIDIDRDREAGVRGGAASYAATYTGTAENEAMLIGRVHWNSVWAGLLVSLAAQLVISSLVFAIAFSSSSPRITVSGLGIWMTIISLISLYVGGYLAARMTGVVGRNNGILHGVVVWALALVLGSIAATIGISGILGYNGVLPSAPFGALRNTPMAIGSMGIGTWWFFIAAVVSLITAGLGGMTGAVHEDEVVHRTIR